jgi:hypothetical protein
MSEDSIIARRTSRCKSTPGETGACATPRGSVWRLQSEAVIGRPLAAAGDDSIKHAFELETERVSGEADVGEDGERDPVIAPDELVNIASSLSGERTSVFPATPSVFAMSLTMSIGTGDPTAAGIHPPAG